MRKLILDNDLLELFPDTKIGVLVCRGIDNHVKDENQYAPLLRECEEGSLCFTGAEEWMQNPVIGS